MPAKQEKVPQVVMMMLNNKLDPDQRIEALRFLAHQNSDDAKKELLNLLKAAGNGMAETLYHQKLADIEEFVESIKTGPQMIATVRKVYAAQGEIRRALVVDPNGKPFCPIIYPPELAKQLQPCDNVVLDADGKLVIGKIDIGAETGEIAKVIRRVRDDLIEATEGLSDRPILLQASGELLEQLNGDDSITGRQVIACSRRKMAFWALPSDADPLARLRFLRRAPIEHVVPERDLGNPPPFIDEVGDFVRMQMTAPDELSRWRIRRSKMLMLTGVTGTGKTLSIKASIYRGHQVAADIAGVELCDLPYRVVEVSTAKVLSMWLGESDKLGEKLVDEILFLARQTWTDPQGRQWLLPTYVIWEEIEAMGRARGTDHEAVFDRIQTTFLRRWPELENAFVVTFCSSNFPALIDPAFARRINAEHHKFDRLKKRRVFAPVMAKLVRDIPMASNNGHNPQHLERQMVNELADALYIAGQDEAGRIAVTFAGSTQPTIYHTRDFLTASILDRAVQRSACRAFWAARSGGVEGLTPALLLDGINEQVQAIVDQVNRHNVAQHVDCPDGSNVATVRRIPQPALPPMQLQPV